MEDSMQGRVHKLLILVGEEGPQSQKRDYKKLSEIVNSYLNQNNQNFNKFFFSIIGKVIKGIPLKQHIYAVLVGDISAKFSHISNQIIENAIKDLENQLSYGNLYQSVNIFDFLAELLNISMFNSSTFLNLVEDLLKAIENQSQQSQHRKIFISVLEFTFPLYAHSLNDKIFHDFKKIIERVKKLPIKNQLVLKIIKDHVKGQCRDYSLFRRLQAKIDVGPQYHANTKLNIQCKFSKQLGKQSPSQIIQYYNFSADKDQLYQIYSKSQGVTHRNNIQKLIQVFYKDSNQLVTKLLNYLIFHQKDQVYLMKFAIETIINKAFKSKTSLVQYFILAQLCKHQGIGKQAQKTLQEQLLLIFNSFCQSLTFDVLMEFTRLLSYIYNSGVLSVVWDWQLYQENSDHQSFKKRVIVLKITFQSISLLNDKAKFQNVQKYLPRSRKNPQEYTKLEDMQTYQGFKEKLGQKATSQVIISTITSQHSYRIFLQTLFQKTSLSLTHLQTLFLRYQQVFQHFKKDYDWVLIDKIRNFWINSYSNRLIYLKQVINRNHVDFKSYVKYIGQLQSQNELDSIEIKLELNQMNKIFGKRLILNPNVNSSQKMETQ